jgi:glycosyltransferase involved in cell wall biosynthesis
VSKFLSVIIANYNYGRFLSEAVESLLAQSCQDFEIIICDAASTDNSVDVITKYAGGLPPNTERESSNEHFDLAPSPITYWCSEKDGGQSAAFNKGFSHAHGRFLTWLNADDVMLPGTIERLKRAAEKFPSCEWFVGGVLWLDPEMRILNCGRGRPFSEIRYREGNVSVWGPSSFFTKRLLDAVGGVDERFHYTMDTDLWLRFASKAGARYRPFCDYAWGLRLHPDAKMSGHNFLADGRIDTSRPQEQRRACSKHRDQMDQESEWRKEYFHARKGNRITHLLSASWLNVLRARIDLLRWRNKCLSSVIGKWGNE